MIRFRKEKKFKLQEAELREKDILIQDNLIKFSTFLQQQEMRKKKEMDQTENELKVSNNLMLICVENCLSWGRYWREKASAL